MKFNLDDLYQIESGASYKKIYRFKNKNIGKVVVNFSYNHNDYLSFLEVNNFLSNINISVPKIFYSDHDKSIIIMEDFGDNRYDKLINSIDPKEILIDAVNSLIEIQNTQKPIVNNIIKQYDFSSFKIEIAEFVDFYLPKNNISDDMAEEFFDIWSNEFKNLNFKWDSFVHKDFELSNLIYLPKRNNHLKCGIIDFQNAFIGFSGWDVFSLLENPRIYFDDKYNDELLEYFFNKTDQNIPIREFLNQYYFLNTARQTRIIGRWINLDNKNNYNYSKYLNVTIKRLKKSLYNLQNKKLSKLYDTLIVE
ncbi:MAG: phosphotransferase [Pelagibacteraceae bacterium]|jgi:aminoglycoside/choline kinase family phosphotransferase|nr:phosphotransferase [Pelagibacteraceae bacterium]MBT4950810.1 phosphotransferase [Pelagibacteraceae bacterium]MBT5213324.1 phosphotransferase [Pelagibacteraceae bacterium]MBT6198151.1 phosphotransferase [Pelagibacteraceae bacterium]MBT6354667.1 phosphotransferase [Pelagibacteraceae bacterium]